MVSVVRRARCSGGSASDHLLPGGGRARLRASRTRSSITPINFPALLGNARSPSTPPRAVGVVQLPSIAFHSRHGQTLRGPPVGLLSSETRLKQDALQFCQRFLQFRRMCREGPGLHFRMGALPLRLDDCAYHASKNYVVHEEIARGANSTTYRATCKRGRLRNRVVALKKVRRAHMILKVYLSISAGVDADSDARRDHGSRPYNNYSPAPRAAPSIHRIPLLGVLNAP